MTALSEQVYVNFNYSKNDLHRTGQFNSTSPACGGVLPRCNEELMTSNGAVPTVFLFDLDGKAQVLSHVRVLW